jgi:ABC-type transport system involved in cytochrome c biogenesis permease subunit
MIFNEELFADAGLLLLGISALGYVLQVLIPKNWLRNLSSGLLALATGSLITSLVFRSMDAEFFALSNMYEALLVLTIAFGIAYLIIERWFKVYNMGWAVCLLALVIMFYAGSLPTEINPLQAALRSYWRSIHVPKGTLAVGATKKP